MPSSMRLRSAERLARVAVGAGLLTYFGFNTQAYWALLGLVPLATGLVNVCPLYVMRRRRPQAAVGGEAASAVEPGQPSQPSQAPSPARPLQRSRKKLKRQSSGRVPSARAAAAVGRVGHVTDGTFQREVLASEQPVLIDFWASWCGPCKMMAPVLDEVAAEVAGSARVVKLDVERSPLTAERFGIRNIPTMILFVDGEVKDVLVGLQAKGKLVKLLQRAA